MTESIASKVCSGSYDRSLAKAHYGYGGFSVTDKRTVKLKHQSIRSLLRREQSCLRSHGRHWREMSVFEKKQVECRSVLRLRRGKKAYRPVLVTDAREACWEHIACGDRDLAEGISFRFGDLSFRTHLGTDHLSGHRFDLKYAQDDACIALRNDYRCCMTCSGEVVNRHEVDEDDYLFLVPLFQVNNGVMGSGY